MIDLCSYRPTDFIVKPLPALVLTLRTPMALVEVTTSTDTNIFLQTTDTAVGKDELNLFLVNAAPNATTRLAYFEAGVKMDPSATVRGTILALYGSDYSMDSFSVKF